MAVKPMELSMAHRLLAGGPVALVATRYRDHINVMAASWFTPISMEPPMVALAVHKGTLTHDYIERSGEFTISLPNLALMEKVRDAGMKSGRDVPDKFAELGLEPVAGEALDTPVVAGCLAYLECSVVEAYDAGEDHTVFFAEVVAASAEQEAFRETWLLEEEEAKPLHHLGGHKYALLEKLLDAAAREEEQE